MFVGTGLRVKRLGYERSGARRSLFPPSLSPHLRDSRLTAVTSVLGHYLKQASWQRSLHYQHRRHENNTFWAVRWWQRGQEVEVRGTTGGLGRYRAGVLLPRPSVRLESHPLRAGKQTPQQSPCRLLSHRKNSRTDSQKVLLADITTRRWSLCHELWRLLDFKGSLA